MGSRGLAERGGAEGGEAVFGFGFEAGDGVVVEVGRDHFFLHAGGLGDHVFLAGDVAGVFDVVFDEAPDLGGEFFPQFGGQGGGGVFGPAQPFFQGHTVEPGLLQELPGGGDSGDFFLGVPDAEGGGEADGGGEGGEAEVAVVLAEEEAVLGAGGEEAVGFGGAFGDQIVDHDGEVGLAALQQERGATGGLERGIGTGDEALAGGFFITGGAIDLSGEVEAGDALRFESGMELGGRAVIILHGIAGADDLGVFEAGDGPDEVVLDLEGQGGGDAVDVEFAGVAALGFEEDLVPLLLRKAHHLVLHRGAVARSDTLNVAGIHGRLVDVRPDDVVRLGGRVGDPAGNLFHVERYGAPGVEGELVRAGGWKRGERIEGRG